MALRSRAMFFLYSRLFFLVLRSQWLVATAQLQSQNGDCSETLYVSGTPSLDYFQEIVERDLTKLYLISKQHKGRHNLTISEFNTLRELQDNVNIVQQADKGGGIVVLDTVI